MVWKSLTGGIGVNSSSPAVANGVVYVPGGVGLYALDANTGAILWQDLGPANSGGSPTVVNGTVYINSSGAYAYHLPSQ
jgi:outer membrane protein assembly factor BamB